MSGLRPIAGPFVAAAPAGARVRTRLRVSSLDETVLWTAGSHLGSLAGRDLAARCAGGRLEAKGQAVSRAARKRALTAESSSRRAGAITRTSEDQVRLAGQNLRGQKASLQARIRRVRARLAIPAGGKDGRVRGYATPAERHAKALRLQVLQARLARVDRPGRSAVRYDISQDPASGRWYLDASWKTPRAPAPSLQDLQRHPVVAVDVNAGHLAVAVVAADGNVLGTPAAIPLNLAGLPSAARDGRLRAAITSIIATARQHGARAIVIEDLDFAQARAEGRERAAAAPPRQAGQGLPAAGGGHPRRQLRDRLVQMAAHAGLHVLVADPRHLPVGSRALARPAAGASPRHDRSPRRSAGDRTTRTRPPGKAPRGREPHRPGGGGTASPRATPDTPGSPGRTQETGHPTRPLAATRHQDQPASPDHDRQPGNPGPSGAAGEPGPLRCPEASGQSIH